jgi:hypothetical protein
MKRHRDGEIAYLLPLLFTPETTVPRFLMRFPESESCRLQFQECRIASHIVDATRFELRYRHKGEIGLINQHVPELVIHVRRETLGLYRS